MNYFDFKYFEKITPLKLDYKGSIYYVISMNKTVYSKSFFRYMFPFNKIQFSHLLICEIGNIGFTSYGELIGWFEECDYNNTVGHLIEKIKEYEK